jgi:hypothetical protein
MIKINEKYSIQTSGEGCTLIVELTKQKEEVIDKVKTGKIVNYQVREPHHYSNVEQCLNKFLSLEQEDAENIKEVLLKIEEVKNLIKGLTNLQK